MERMEHRSEFPRHLEDALEERMARLISLDNEIQCNFQLDLDFGRQVRLIR